MPLTVVAVNAHPDDEAILMGGTLARFSAAGHRVVLVTATDGDAGMAASAYGVGGLGARRLRELRASALALGVAEVVDLGYGDSGMGPAALPPSAARPRLQTVPLDHVASRVAEVLIEQAADIVIGYDRAGGYGHRDHVQVHRIVRRAVERLSDRRPVRLLEATAPREPLLAGVRLLRLLRVLRDVDPSPWAAGFTASAQITHRVDVRSQIHAKRAALNAHTSQHSSDGARRTMARAMGVPTPVFVLALGREYFVEPGRDAALPRRCDAFADLVRDAA
ncbi:MAG: PIG-L family deacetylase [Ornithinimicrobium sp.]